jgi:histidine kinase
LLGEQLSGRGIEVVVDIPDGLPNVQADESQLEQVLINLLNNARDALSDSGVSPPSPRIRLKAEAEILPGDGELRICLHVQDNGPGMGDDVGRRVFEPFFTTKEVGKGTGLGLSISYSLVRGFGGTLAFRSRPGEGTTFSILLKTVAPPASLPSENP